MSRFSIGQQKIYTTGQLARLFQVSPRTVSRWFDSGSLRGYRIPGSLDRRIPEPDLIEFIRAHGLPDVLVRDHALVAITGMADADAEVLAGYLDDPECTSWFDSDHALGRVIADRVDAIIIETGCGSAIARRWAETAAAAEIPVIAYGPCTLPPLAGVEYLGSRPGIVAVAEATVAAIEAARRERARTPRPYSYATHLTRSTPTTRQEITV